MHPVDKAITKLRASEVGKPAPVEMSNARRAEILDRCLAMLEPMNARQILPVFVTTTEMPHGRRIEVYGEGFAERKPNSMMEIYSDSPSWRFAEVERILGMENEPGILPNYGRIYRMKFKTASPTSRAK